MFCTVLPTGNPQTFWLHCVFIGMFTQISLLPMLFARNILTFRAIKGFPCCREQNPESLTGIVIWQQ